MPPQEIYIGAEKASDFLTRHGSNSWLDMALKVVNGEITDNDVINRISPSTLQIAAIMEVTKAFKTLADVVAELTNAVYHSQTNG